MSVLGHNTRVVGQHQRHFPHSKRRLGAASYQQFVERKTGPFTMNRAGGHDEADTAESADAGDLAC
jgi:hypothetical protein